MTPLRLLLLLSLILFARATAEAADSLWQYAAPIATATSVAVDGSGFVYTFGEVNGASGMSDVIVRKYTAGMSLVSSFLIGGSEAEHPGGFVVIGTTFYVTGQTFSRGSRVLSWRESASPPDLMWRSLPASTP